MAETKTQFEQILKVFINCLVITRFAWSNLHQKNICGICLKKTFLSINSIFYKLETRNYNSYDNIKNVGILKKIEPFF